MLRTFCPLTILGDFYRIPEKSPKSSADKMNRACESKDQTLEKMIELYIFQTICSSRSFPGIARSPPPPPNLLYRSRGEGVAGVSQLKLPSGVATGKSLDSAENHKEKNHLK